MGRRVRRRKGIEGVDATKEYLKWGIQCSPRVGQGRRGERERTNSFGVDVEMVLIVVYVPEGRVASVRDVSCSKTFRRELLEHKK